MACQVAYDETHLLCMDSYGPRHQEGHETRYWKAGLSVVVQILNALATAQAASDSSPLGHAIATPSGSDCGALHRVWALEVEPQSEGRPPSLAPLTDALPASLRWEPLDSAVASLDPTRYGPQLADAIWRAGSDGGAAVRAKKGSNNST